MRTIVLPFLFLLFSCTGETGQHSQLHQEINFYFPVKSFFIETTYCFVNQNDTTEKSYWQMKTSLSGKDTLLETSIFDTKGRILETMTEKVANGNASIYSYILFDYDEQGNKVSANCKIIDNSVFKSNQSETEQIQWKVSFKGLYSAATCELSKRRRVKSQSSHQKTFTDSMKFAVEDIKQVSEYSVTSVYEKNKGLVAYKLVLPDGTEKDFVLASEK